MDQHPDQHNFDKRSEGKGVTILVVGFLVLAIGFLSGWLLAGGNPSDGTNAVRPDGTQAVSPDGGVDDWAKIDRIRNQIYELYDGPIEEEELLEGAVKGMVESLGDPYSQFYNAEEYARLNEDSSGKFVGVGIQINAEDDNIVVVAPIEGSPAMEAGIKSGDVIIRIDGTVYKGSDINEAVSYMRGEEGEPVTLTIRRDNQELDFTIIRREITSASVSYEMMPDRIGFIQLYQFTKDVDKDVRAALDDLASQGAEGFVLDLRGNPGGYLQESINIASNFIKKGEVIVSTKDKHGNKHEDFSIGGDYIGTPLTVLIDMGSASASEVVAGALKDYDAAVLLGTKSYGKGIVQTIMNLDKGEGLKLTVAAYYSPKGTNIHQIGIAPDIIVEMPEDLTNENYSIEKDPQIQRALEELKKLIQEEKSAA